LKHIANPPPPHSHRLGWLNIFNCEKPDGIYDLDCDIHEHRIMVNMLTKLSIVEEGHNVSCPGIPLGENFCTDRECFCHWYQDDKHYFENNRLVGKEIPVHWDDPKYQPDIMKFHPKPQLWKSKRQQTKERALPVEGRFSTLFVSADDKNEELRKLLNEMYCLVGTPILDRHPDKIRRELSYCNQLY